MGKHGLGPRESLAEAVSAVINLLGMQTFEVCKSICFVYLHNHLLTVEFISTMQILSLLCNYLII
jgi:hypothetical protein